MTRTLATAVGLAAIALAGCKNDGPDAAAFCAPIGGGAAVATEVCETNCNQEDIAAAVDADFGTAAIVGLSVQNQGSIRGTAQDGIVFPADRAAGVYLNKPPLVRGTFELTVATYLDGVLQESALAFSEGDGSTFCNSCASHGANLFVGIPTSRQYDAIEMSYTQAGTQYREIQVIEFCRLAPAPG